ncbi:DUF481 domain-containing protein [Sphingobium boeckii]|uniref:Putative salt-induced outer membrane protein n=1 Tax=Sphingobium boeckii TaxID=1082345 RepID=A0A7W9AGV2_9SPHN|nr:DUF481 domain-containing protein [Sphingobium boeckii]MBB5685209.1 putative salt-induced outer membrane protein [Sphingobium boeckii]
MRALLAAFLAPAFCCAAPAAAMPHAVRVMLDAAVASGDDAEIAAIAKYAKLASPDDIATIDAVVAARKSGLPQPVMPSLQVAAVQPTLYPAAVPLIPWKGSAELGGFLATGNSEYIGATAAVNVSRESAQWRHSVIIQGDYQESDGITTRQRVLTSWQPRYKFSEQGFAYGLAQYEHDPFLGYDSRYTLSGGMGYRAIGGERLKLDLEAGPALRLTQFSEGGFEPMVAGRGSFTLDWKPRPGISFTQNAALYADAVTSTLNGTTAFTAKVVGPLSARLSYNVQYESNPPDGRRTTDTLSRASLVYDF